MNLIMLHSMEFLEDSPSCIMHHASILAFIKVAHDGNLDVGLRLIRNGEMYGIKTIHRSPFLGHMHSRRIRWSTGHVAPQISSTAFQSFFFFSNSWGSANGNLPYLCKHGDLAEPGVRTIMMTVHAQQRGYRVDSC